MKHLLLRLLRDFDYASIPEFAQSLFPTSRYGISTTAIVISGTASIAETVFGMNWLAFLAFLAVMVAEVVTGLLASHVKKVPFSSAKLSRFSLKVAAYLVLISAPHLMAISYSNHNELASTIFNWIHVFLVVQISVEYMVSILENIAVIDGKPKTHLIGKIKDKIDNLLS